MADSNIMLDEEGKGDGDVQEAIPVIALSFFSPKCDFMYDSWKAACGLMPNLPLFAHHRMRPIDLESIVNPD